MGFSSYKIKKHWHRKVLYAEKAYLFLDCHMAYWRIKYNIFWCKKLENYDAYSQINLKVALISNKEQYV